MARAHESWQEMERDRQEVVAKARGLEPEPSVAWVRVLLGLSVLVWLGSLVWGWFVLPDRVPVHYSGRVPDRWDTRLGALLPAFLVPLLVIVPMPLISRLVLLSPDVVNAPAKEWWLAEPRRLRRFERLIREDMSVVAASMLLMFASIVVAMKQSAKTTDGAMPVWEMWVIGVTVVVPLVFVMLRMYTGTRYRPRDGRL